MPDDLSIDFNIPEGITEEQQDKLIWLMSQFVGYYHKLAKPCKKVTINGELVNPSTKQTLKTIEICLDGGLVTDISGIPEGYNVSVRDYDTECCEEPEALSTDKDGDEYIETIHD